MANSLFPCPCRALPHAKPQGSNLRLQCVAPVPDLWPQLRGLSNQALTGPLPTTWPSSCQARVPPLLGRLCLPSLQTQKCLKSRSQRAKPSLISNHHLQKQEREAGLKQPCARCWPLTLEDVWVKTIQQKVVHTEPFVAPLRAGEATAQARAPTLDLSTFSLSLNKRGCSLLPFKISDCVVLNQWAAGGTARRDGKVLAIANHYLDPTQYHLASKAVLQQLLGTDPKAMQKRLGRLGALMWFQQLQERHRLEGLLADNFPADCLVCYLEACAYDETPLKIRTKESFLQSPTGIAAPVADVAESQAQTAGLKRSEVVIAKILQTKASFAMLIKHPESYLDWLVNISVLFKVCPPLPALWLPKL